MQFKDSFPVVDYSASFTSNLNVYNTALNILRQRGYQLGLRGNFDEQGSFVEGLYFAEKDSVLFSADTPIELLGMTAIYEFVDPQGQTPPYWWRVEGADIHDELIEEALRVLEVESAEDLSDTLC